MIRYSLSPVPQHCVSSFLTLKARYFPDLQASVRRLARLGKTPATSLPTKTDMGVNWTFPPFALFVLVELDNEVNESGLEFATEVDIAIDHQ